MQVTRDDVYHAIVDPRMWRHPERIEFGLRGIFEIRTADLGRRLALTSWEEEDVRLYGTVIIEVENTLRTMHVMSERRMRRYQRRGELPWRSGQ